VPNEPRWYRPDPLLESLVAMVGMGKLFLGPKKARGRVLAFRLIWESTMGVGKADAFPLRIGPLSAPAV